MLFYRVEVKMSVESEAVNRREQNERAAAMQPKIDELFDKSGQSCHISVSSFDYKKQKLMLCAALKHETLSKRTVASFLDTVDLLYKQGDASTKPDVQGSSFDIQEITLNSYFSLLRVSGRNGFIEDEDDVIEKLCLDVLNPRRHQEINFSETLTVCDETQKELLDKSALLLCDASLSVEIKRIYKSRKCEDAPIGHPVHYMLQSGSKGTRNQALRILHTALYQNKRIESRRYCELDLEGLVSLPEGQLNALYEACSGGTIVIPFCEAISDENKFANVRAKIIGAVCTAMRKHRNSALTVFCLPLTSNKALLLENLGAVTVVPICEEAAFEGRAKSFLRELARQYNVKPNSALFRPIVSGKGYSTSELNLIFDEWYDSRLKTDIYSQYAQLQTANKQLAAKKPKGSAYDDLQKMVGLKEVKSVIQQAIDLYKAQKLFKEKGLNSERPAMHMVFTGNPGTAKTTVARLFAQIMKDKDYGSEAINTLVKGMEDNRANMAVIFAGYVEETHRMIDSNPGLRGRIAFTVRFPDYNAAELFKIFRKLCCGEGFVLTFPASEKIKTLISRIYAVRDSHFSNGRCMRSLFECTKLLMARRVAGLENPTKETLSEITAEDIVALEQSAEAHELLSKRKAVKSIGFIPASEESESCTA